MVIKSTNDFDIFINSSDLELISQYAWTVTKDGYAKKYLEWKQDGVRKRKVVYMHRLIMDAKENQIIDHINQNKADNRRSNLRIASKSLNALNSHKTRSTTGYRGVISNKQKGKPFKARLTIDGKQIHLGTFNTPQEAHKAYLTKQKEVTS